MLKRLLNSPATQTLIGRLIGIHMLIVGWTTRWRKVNHGRAKEVWANGKGVIVCVWHGRFSLTHALWSFKAPAQHPLFLVSQSREGGIAAETARTVGASVVRGSSAKGAKRKGGFEALRVMKRHLDDGGCVGMTPDGPKGPRMRAKLGPVQLAKLSGAPLFPLAWSTKWRKQLSSWDAMLLAYPFGRGALVWGEPIYVPRDADDAQMEACRAALEAELNRISAEADTIAGVPVIAPDVAPAMAEA